MNTTAFPVLTYTADVLAQPGRLTPPEDGVYICDEATYRRIDALAQSSVKIAVTDSLADFKFALTHPRQPTQDMLRGRAGHLYILEPAEYERSVVVMPDVGRKSAAGQAQWVEAAASMIPDRFIEWERACEGAGFKLHHDGAFALAAEMAGRTVVDPKWLEQLRAVRDAVMGHPDCAAALQAASVREVAIVATCPETGLRVKGRVDQFAVDAGHVLDFKFPTKLGPAVSPYPGIIRLIRAFRYDFQVAWYEWLFELVGMKTVMELAFVQWDDSGKTPIDTEHVVVVNLADADIEAAHTDRKRVLSRIAEAQRTDCWPGFPRLLKVAARPMWDMPLED